MGNADPRALTLTISAMEAFRFIGPPEGHLALAQACVYLCLCGKKQCRIRCVRRVRSDVKTLPEYPVPMHIRNAPTKLMKELGYGHEYLYPHDFEDGLVKQDYLPEEMRDRQYYRPTDRGYERQLKEFLEKVRKINNRD